MAKYGSPDANAICDASGFKVKLSALVRQWDGALVDRRFVDRRNQQDFVRGVPDKQALPYSRPETPDSFLVGTVRPEDL